MIEIREFCDRINANKMDIFKRCKDLNEINRNAEKIEELKPEELEIYHAKVKEYYNSYLDSDVWKQVIIDSILFQKPNLVNAHMKHFF
jgi:hypothetical protein